VEEFLYRHPAIQDVQVFGVPDDRYGEALAAWIVLRPDERLSEEAVQAQGRIAHYKIPRYVRFVEAFPTTVTGKVQKFAMREAMTAELKLTARQTA
jgi:fatty-acyl-CoA synthase